MANQEDTFGLTDESINGKQPPSPRWIEWLHKKVSTSKATDVHHPLGTGPTEASPGDHDHDGKNSKRLWNEETILTDLAPGSSVDTVIDAVNKLNAAIRAKGAVS